MPTVKEICASGPFLSQLQTLVGEVGFGEMREENDDGITRLKIPVFAKEKLGTYTVVLENGITRAITYQGKHPLAQINVHLYARLEGSSYIRVDAWDAIEF